MALADTLVFIDEVTGLGGAALATSTNPTAAKAGSALPVLGAFAKWLAQFFAPHLAVPPVTITTAKVGVSS